MIPSSTQYARLSQDAYRPAGTETFRILAQADCPSGYQGTIYQSEGDDAGAVVVAHRGTEFGREMLRDVIATGGGMLLRGVNVQADDAIAFTERALALAGGAATVTVTGHSLGGCLAQITAHALGLGGETFNAYGAAGLRHGIPEGGTGIVNHVRATDFISAGSRHFGDVRVYATEHDIAHLDRHGYRDASDARLPFTAALCGYALKAHQIGCFHDEADPLLQPGNQSRYLEFQAIVDGYRADVHDIRSRMLSAFAPRELLRAILRERSVRGAGKAAARPWVKALAGEPDFSAVQAAG